jgi:hypothetical protein
MPGRLNAQRLAIPLGRILWELNTGDTREVFAELGPAQIEWASFRNGRLQSRIIRRRADLPRLVAYAQERIIKHQSLNRYYVPKGSDRSGPTRPVS